MWPEMPLPQLAFKNALLKPFREFRVFWHKTPFFLARLCNKPFSAPESVCLALLCVGHTNLCWVTRGGSRREAGYSTTATIKTYGSSPVVSPNTTHLFSLSEESTNTSSKLYGISGREQTMAVATLSPLITQLENIRAARLLGAVGPETCIKQPVRLQNPIRTCAHLRGNAIFGGKIWLESSPITCRLCFVAQSCPTPCDPVHGIFQAKVLEWIATSSFKGIFPTQGSNLCLLQSRQILYLLSHRGSPITC